MSTPRRLAAIPRPSCPIGTIAGTRSYLPFTSRLINGRHDGLVSLERSRLDGADWIALDAGHTFLMNHPDVIIATVAYLEHGRFPDQVAERSCSASDARRGDLAPRLDR